MSERDEDRAYDSGYAEGFDDGLDKGAELPPFAETLRESLRLKGIDATENVTVRYDAALKAFLWTQDGREVRLDEEA